MKKIITIIAAAVLIISCGKELTKEEKFKNKIETVLIKNLNDPKSYEFISITKIDTFYLKNSALRYKKLYQEWVNDTTDYYENKREENINKLNHYKSILDTVSDKTIDEIGVTINYRAKNKLGGLVVSDGRFYFDDKFNIVRVK